MWEGSYGGEPFDLRLTMLRLLRSLHLILAAALAGAVLFGGGYYIKNVLLAEKLYTSMITCKVQYTDPPTKAGDYFINYATWGTYVGSQEFLELLTERLPAGTEAFPGGAEELKSSIFADVPSDGQVPTFTITCDTEKKTEILVQAAAQTLTGPWAERLPEVVSIEVIDTEPVHPYTDEFVRPLRAFVFGAVTACFFAVVLFLLRETGADSIWLPAALRVRYGLVSLGTAESVELKENIRYAFEEKNGRLSKIAVCAADDGIDSGSVADVLREKGVLNPSLDWIPMPAPGSDPEAVRKLREADGLLLAVPAGLHTGKPLERVLEFLREQDVKITGVLLWNADERLIRDYYRMKR